LGLETAREMFTFHGMSATETADAIAKLQGLSEERAQTVYALIEDLTQLEALEDAEDLKDALKTLKELEDVKSAPVGSHPGTAQFTNEDDSPTIPWEKLKKELNL
jgi:beta-phosphoglucomutase-like phosphatase (HAD superfamily)